MVRPAGIEPATCGFKAYTSKLARFSTFSGSYRKRRGLLELFG
jgi:hypothetical protein